MEAKEMFEEIGYILLVTPSDKEAMFYKYRYLDCSIQFWFKEKKVYLKNISHLTISEINAIYKQSEELGWSYEGL
jgi:hypothetical protein